MKLTIILLFVIELQNFASVFSQNISVDAENQSVRDVLNQIESQSNYRFFYNDKLTGLDELTSIKAENKSINDLLEQLFNTQEFYYRVLENNMIVVAPRELIEQGDNITGKVTDPDGNPLPGVNVVEKGTTNGTVTNLDGIYTISVSSPDAALSFSFVGYLTEDILINGQSELNVILVEDILSLDEVVVVGYSVQAKKDITGSISVIKTDELLSTPSASFTGQLQGRAAGLVIGSSGAPGSVNTIRIRGIGSVNDNSPLYVIDGVSTRDQDMSNINPNDIESIQILKDASAASIYGAQAANGVIIITTKKGTNSGEPKLTYDAYYGFQSLTKSYDLLNSQEWMESEYLKLSNSYAIRGQSTVPSHAQFGTGTFSLPDFLIPSGANEGDANTTLADYNSETNRITRTNKIGTNWFDEITQTAPIQNHQLSLLGGSDKGSYSLGLNYFTQEGTAKYSYYDRFSVRANSQFNVRPNIRMGENLSMSYAKFNDRNSEAEVDAPIGRAMMVVPYVPIYDISGDFAGNIGTSTGASSNAYAERVLNKNDENTNLRLLGNLFAEIDLTKDLKFRSSFGIDYKNNLFIDMHRHEAWTTSSGPTSLTETYYNNMRWVFNNVLTYKKIIGDHNLTFLVGTESIKDNIGRTISASRQNYLFEDDTNTWTLNNGDGSTAINSDVLNGEVTFLSFFERIDYIYANKYMLTATVRRDGSSRFAESERYGYFPAISAGWRLSEENFLQNADALDNLKLRLGYGVTGNSEIPEAYNWASQYTSIVSKSYYDYSNTQGTGAVGYYLSTYSNSKTKWETSNMLNAGLDVSMFNYGLDITMDYFIKKTSGMLTRASYSALAGTASAPFINVGDMENKGFEFSLTHRKTITKDLSYEISGNYSMYRNKVIRLSDNDNYAIYGEPDNIGSRIGYINITQKDQSIGMFYGWNILGFYDDEAEVTNYKNSEGETVLPYGVSSNSDLNPTEWVGKYIYEDVNNDGKIDGNDMTIIGNPHPDFVASLNTNVNYKNFDFNMYWYASVGNEIYRLYKQYIDYSILDAGRSKDVLYDSWTPDNQDAILPILDAQDAASIAGSHSAYVEDGSFLKLKNISVGYTFPSDLTNKLKINGARIYVQGSNILTITKYKGLDPEIGNLSTEDSSGDINKGIDGGYWPAPRQILFGITINL